MAYDPRTGITTYDQPDVAGDPNAALAADVGEAVPSTATSFALPTGPISAAQYLALAPSIDDWESYAKWAQGVSPDPTAFFSGGGPITAGWSRDDWNLWNTQGPFRGTSPDITWTGRLAQLGMPETRTGMGEAEFIRAAGPTATDLMYGGVGYAQEAIDDVLRQIAAAGGRPDMDWTPYLRQGARQHFEQFGSLPINRDSNPVGLVYSALSNAAVDHPELAAYLESVGPGSDLWAQGEAARQAQADAATQDKRNYYTGLLSVLSGPFLAWAGPALSAAMSSASTSGMSAAGAAAAEGVASAGGGLAAELAAGAPELAGAYAGAGNTLLNTLAQGALRGGVSGLASGDPLKGALRGMLSAGVSDYGLPLVQSAFDTFAPEIAFATDPLADSRRLGLGTGMLPETPEMFTADFFAPMTAAGDLAGLDLPITTQAMMADTFSDPLTAQLAIDAIPELGLGANGILSPLDALSTMRAADPFELPTTQDVFGTEAPQWMVPDAALDTMAAPQSQQEAARAKEPSLVDKAERFVKLGAQLAKIFGGQGVPEDAPQQAEGQSTEEYAQALAQYINVDPQALADMGLVPGTPEYYEYIMSQIDATVQNLTGTLDVDAPNLMEQIRGKTREELTALRRALFVRGQLEQLMGSGTYTDPFTGRAEQVITNGRRVNPGVAAYHRGLGRTAAEFARLSPMERQRAIGGFLGRDADLYGMQERADVRAEQAAQAQAFLEDLKRRRGMFSQFDSFPGFSMAGTGDPQLDELLGLFSQ